VGDAHDAAHIASEGVTDRERPGAGLLPKVMIVPDMGTGLVNSAWSPPGPGGDASDISDATFRKFRQERLSCGKFRSMTTPDAHCRASVRPVYSTEAGSMFAHLL
jgi:hypothetical protein